MLSLHSRVETPIPSVRLRAGAQHFWQTKRDAAGLSDLRCTYVGGTYVVAVLEMVIFSCAANLGRSSAVKAPKDAPTQHYPTLPGGPTQPTHYSTLQPTQSKQNPTHNPTETNPLITQPAQPPTLYNRPADPDSKPNPTKGRPQRRANPTLH